MKHSKSRHIVRKLILFTLLLGSLGTTGWGLDLNQYTQYLLKPGFKRFIVKNSDLNEIENFVMDQRHTIYRRMDDDKAVIVGLNKKSYRALKAAFPQAQIEEDRLVQLKEFHQDFLDVLLASSPSVVDSASKAQVPQSIPWGIAAIDAVRAHQYSTGKGVIVCLLHTGVNTTHPDLKGQVIAGRSFVEVKGKVRPKKFQDDNGHGTHVAGIIAALDNKIGVVGVAPEAKLVVAKVLDRQGRGYISDLADGLLYCLKKGARVASMSLGTSIDSPILRDAIIDAKKAGLTMVAASGNAGGGVVDYPAAYPEVLAVSAINSQLALASFSNTGPEVDYAAPGVGILSTSIDNGYVMYSGTSMAAPHVAGVVALALAAMRSQIETEDLGLTNNEQGLGMVNALKTVQP